MNFQKGWGNGLTNQNRRLPSWHPPHPLSTNQNRRLPSRHPPHPLSDYLRYHSKGILGLKLSPLYLIFFWLCNKHYVRWDFFCLYCIWETFERMPLLLPEKTSVIFFHY
jgi:hypothetical protein